MRFTAVVRRLPPPFYTTVKRKNNVSDFGLEKFRDNELQFEQIGNISNFVTINRFLHSYVLNTDIL